MCGIAGVFAYGDGAPLVDGAELEAMNERMRPRGPDAAGLWLNGDFARSIAVPKTSNFSKWSLALRPLYFSSACLIHSSMIGAERFFASACICALAVTMLAPAALSAFKPTWSALSQDWPFERAAYSPACFSMTA